jgi:hypothetical protein
MHRSRLPLYFALVLSGLIWSGSSASSKPYVTAIKCHVSTISTLQPGYIDTGAPGGFYCPAMNGCTCTVTFCPTLCPPQLNGQFSPQQCTFQQCFPHIRQ